MAHVLRHPLCAGKSIDTLNGLLRGELSAIETYEQAINLTYQDAHGPIAVLEENRQCHHGRVPVLNARISELGGIPTGSSGAWGVFAGVIEGGARLFGRDAAIAVLEEGEDRGLADYRGALDNLDAISAEIVRSDLLPAQERTHSRMSLLKITGTRALEKPARSAT